MVTAKDYRVSFGYGAVDGTYYTADKPHRGNDRSTPSGTPIVIGGDTIGHTGDTGLVSGPHLHTQAGSDINCQYTVDPTPFEFQSGVVVRTGTASQWGRYIIIHTKTGNYICYAHLSQINVIVGQNVGEDMERIAQLEASEQTLAKEVVARDKVIEALKSRVANLEASEQHLAAEVVARDRRIEVLEATQGSATKWETVRVLLRELLGIK